MKRNRRRRCETGDNEFTKLVGKRGRQLQKQERCSSERERPYAGRTRSQQRQSSANSRPSLSTKGGRVDIPGFYYDPEKKKYFRITREHPGPDDTEKQTHCGIEEDPGQAKQRTQPLSRSIVKCLWDRECNSARRPPRIFLEKLAQQLKVRQTLTLEPFIRSHLQHSDVSVARIEPDKDRSRIVTLYDSHQGGQIVQFHCLSKDRNNKLEIIPKMAMRKEQLVTGLMWSPHQSTSDHYILSLLGQNAQWGETLMFQVDDRTQRHVATFPMRQNSLWCSAWNKNPQYSHILGMGGSKLAVTVDVNTRRRVTYVRGGSDVFAMEFSRQDPLFYYGTRNGCVRRYDIRVKDSHWLPICLKHGSLASITCVRLLDDENYLMASTLNGQIKKWDIRNRRCVQDYSGHVNTYKHKLPFFLDASNSLMFAAGQDSVTRIWSVTSGELLHSIVPPKGVSACCHAPIPALYFADEWGGPGGLPGLMHGTRTRVTWYTY